MLESVVAISEKIKSPIIAMFSTGMDSIVMTDLLVKHLGPARVIPVHLYYVDRLTWVDQIIRYYETRWGVEVRQHPHPDVDHLVRSTALAGKKQVTMTMMENFVREKYGTPWLAYGYLKNDSLQRRGMLSLRDKRGIKTGESGIDWKYHKIYPIAEWPKRSVARYIKDNKLPLPKTYEVGLRDFTTLHGEELFFIINNYPQDWERIVAKYPDLRAEKLRLEMAYD